MEVPAKRFESLKLRPVGGLIAAIEKDRKEVVASGIDKTVVTFLTVSFPLFNPNNTIKML